MTDTSGSKRRRTSSPPEEMIGKRYIFAAIVGKKAYTAGGSFDMPLVHVKDVRAGGSPFEDQAFFVQTSVTRKLNLREGDEVRFTATVREKNSIDWLDRPRNWTVLSRNSVKTTPVRDPATGSWRANEIGEEDKKNGYRTDEKECNTDK